MVRKEYRHEMVEDPATGERYWKTEKVELPSLDEERRMSLVLEILGGKVSPEEVRKSCTGWPVSTVYILG